MTDNDYAEVDRKVTGYHSVFKPDIDKGLKRLHAEIESDARATSRTGHGSPRRQWLTIAAGLLFLLFAGGWYFFNQSDNTVVIAEGKMITFGLPDGTEVMLKAGSQLSYSKDYGVVDRKISLVGEGFFAVIPDKSKPFLAQQGEVTLRVVGTSFNLRAIPETDFFEVEVSSGKVMLETKTATLPVSARECGAIKTGGKLTKRDAPYLNNHAWRTGKMSFKESLFSKVIEVVERTYGVVIDLAEADVKDCDFTLTATFIDAPLVDVFAHLEQLSGGHFEKVSATDYRLADWCIDQ